MHSNSISKFKTNAYIQFQIPPVIDFVMFRMKKWSYCIHSGIKVLSKSQMSALMFCSKGIYCIVFTPSLTILTDKTAKRWVKNKKYLLISHLSTLYNSFQPISTHKIRQDMLFRPAFDLQQWGSAPGMGLGNRCCILKASNYSHFDATQPSCNAAICKPFSDGSIITWVLERGLL